VNRFSDRIGVTKPPLLAREGMSEELRAALWNIFQPRLFADDHSDWTARMTRLYHRMRWRAHTISVSQSMETQRLEQWFFTPGRKWFEIYNFVEFASEVLVGEWAPERLFDSFNKAFEDEGSIYRFVGGVLTAITDPMELEAVRDALATPDRFAGAREHLSTALGLLGLRPEPDFRNAIKEAISAVESTLKILTGNDHADLAEALREFVRERPIHGALFKGLDSLYGYTSNEHGLRHGLIEADANVGFAEAKFMIVACAAFMSFLIAKAAPQ
jgi:hypothetical protein